MALVLALSLLAAALLRPAPRAIGAALAYTAIFAVAALIGRAIGRAIKRRRAVGTVTEPEGERHSTAEARHASSDAPAEQPAMLLFAQALLAATSREQFRRVITHELPPLLGTRRFWISSKSWGQRQVLVPASSDDARRENYLYADGREWATFCLRVGDNIIGVVGLDSEGGLRPHVRNRVQLLAPLIAQALYNSQTVDALRETTVVDLLTRVATRREGLSRLRAEVKRAQRTGSMLAVLMIDLDHFKSINDRFGHAIGDAILAATGRTMLRTLRASDIRCRWGGEEFLVAIPDTDLNRAQVVARNLLRDIAAITISTAEGPISPSASIGLTMSRAGEMSDEAMVRRADVALYRAKTAGRGCVRVVLGDAHGEPLGGAMPSAEMPSARPPEADRRDLQRPDRRQVPSPGRRSTDPRRSSSARQPPEQAPFGSADWPAHH